MRHLNRLGYLGLILATTVSSTSWLGLAPRWFQPVQLWLLVPLLLLPFGWRLAIVTAVILGWSADVFSTSIFFGSHMIAYAAAVGLTALAINSWHSNRTWLKIMGGVGIGSVLAWLFVFILELIAGLFNSQATTSNFSLAYLVWALSSVLIHAALSFLMMPLLIHFTKQQTASHQYG